jgi:hypothetical protein
MFEEEWDAADWVKLLKLAANGKTTLSKDQLKEVAAFLFQQATEIVKLKSKLEEEGEIVITTSFETGKCLAVTRQDEEGRILRIVWEAPDVVEQDEPSVEEALRVLHSVETSVQSGINVTDGWRILRNLISKFKIVPHGVQKAIENAGFTLVKNQFGYHLMKLGKIEAHSVQDEESQPVAWRLRDEEPGMKPRWVYYDEDDFVKGVIPHEVFPKLQKLYTK